MPSLGLVVWPIQCSTVRVVASGEAPPKLVDELGRSSPGSGPFGSSARAPAVPKLSVARAAAKAHNDTRKRRTGTRIPANTNHPFDGTISPTIGRLAGVYRG